MKGNSSRNVIFRKLLADAKQYEQCGELARELLAENKVGQDGIHRYKDRHELCRRACVKHEIEWYRGSIGLSSL